MKITIYELITLIKNMKAPKKIKINEDILNLEIGKETLYRFEKGCGSLSFDYYIDNNKLDNKIEILDKNFKLEEEKKFTKEDFIKQRMELDCITRKQFDERYEVKECNCGMPYCRGFIAVEKLQEEKKIPEKLEQFDDVSFYTINEYTWGEIVKKINSIIDYLKSKGDE